MIRKTLPDPDEFNQKNKSPEENNIIVAQSHKKYNFPEHSAPYLLVSNQLNRGKYCVNNKPVSVSERYFYFLNKNDKFSITFNESVPIETLLVQFSESFILTAYHVASSSEDTLLDDPRQTFQATPYVPLVPFEMNSAIHQSLAALKRDEIATQDELDNILLELAGNVFALNKMMDKQMTKIRVAKKSTQEELCRRLLLAKYFILDNFQNRICLDQVANEVCMNKFHLLKAFKEFTGMSPHQFTTQVRLERARQLLSLNRYSVTDVCHLTGFESLGSFSNLYKRKFGVSPSLS